MANRKNYTSYAKEAKIYLFINNFQRKVDQ